MKSTTGIVEAIFVVLCLGLPFVVDGCDLLKTRDPEDPEVSGATFLPPDTYDIVVENLQAAVREKHATNYRQCLVDSNFSDKQFQFEPNSEAAAQHGAIFANWSVEAEENYFSRLSSERPTGVSRLDFVSPVFNNLSSAEVVFTAKYHLVFQHLNNTIPEEARGNIQLYIALETERSRWSIYRWIDTRDTSQTTWSDFKGTFFTGGF